MLRKFLALVLVGTLLAGGSVLANVVSTNPSRGSGGGGISFGGASGGTATRVLFSDGSGNLADDADMTFATDTLTITKIVSSGVGLFSGAVTFGSAADAVNAIAFNETAGQITWEGAAADTAEHRLAVTVNAGFDTLTTIPATGASQTVAVLENAQTFSGTKTFTASTLTLTNGANDVVIRSQGTAATSGGEFLADAPNVQGYMAAYGASVAGTRFGVPIAGAVMYETFGSSVTAAVYGTNTVDPVILGTNALQREHFVPSAKTLTAGAATSVVSIAVASGTIGGGSVDYTVQADDATDYQARSGRVSWQVVNKAGTETCVVSGFDGTANPIETQDGSSLAGSSGTLTYTWGVDTTGSNACALTLNAVSSLTETTLNIFYTVRRHHGTGTITPQ